MRGHVPSSPPGVKVALLATAMCAATAAVWTAGLGGTHDGGPAAWSLSLPWWILLPMFVAAEVVVFHLQYRREARSVSASEIPLVLGLHLSAPGVLQISRLVSGLLVFVVHRRQTPLKVAFNVALLLLDTTAAIVVFDVIAQGARPLLDTRGWIAAVCAAVVSSVIDALLLSLVISWYDQAFSWRSAVKDLWFGGRLAALVGTVGVIPVFALAVGTAAVLPLVAAGVVLVLGFRSYAELADRHTSLSRLYQFSEAVTVAPSTEAVLRSVLQESRELLRAETAYLYLPSESGDGFTRWSLHLDTPGDAVLSPTELAAATLVATVFTDGRSSVMRPRPIDSAQVFGAQVTEAILAPLRIDGAVAAVLAVADRLGEVRGFEQSDSRLLETVANHAAVALQNGHLIARLRHDAMHDELTGLPNRAMFHELAQKATERSIDGGPPVAVMIMDLDGFKTVNDTLGHQIGDQLLIELAHRLAAAADAAMVVLGTGRHGGEVTVARLGGDEFAVLALGVSTDAEALAVAHHLLACMDKPVVVDQLRLPLAGSLGIALGPMDGTSASTLLRCADIAMYAAKQSTGGARVYDASLVTTNDLSLPLAADLREAIAGGEVGIDVQPIVSVLTGELMSVEALVRWTHPERGQLQPDVFLGIAERAGLIGPLTDAVLRDALLWSRQWTDEGMNVRVSVNISPRTLSDPDLPRAVAAALERHGVAPNRLMLEITENSVIADPDGAIAILEQLRAIGVRLSVDDFGTGYSSLTYLSRLPVHQLKIDRSFVANLLANQRDEAIVRSILDLAKNLDLEVVAEGVEDPAVLARLGELGCDFVQGYWVARPMPASRLSAWREELMTARPSMPAQEPVPQSPSISPTA